MDCSTSGELAAEAQAPHQTPDLRGVEAGVSEHDVLWRAEVAARLERYRTRRKPRAPKYPSLRLPFDSAQTSFSASTAAARAETVSTSSTHNLAFRPDPLEERDSLPPVANAPLPARVQASDQEALSIGAQYELSNVIEFPRSAVIPVFHGDALAEPVSDRPRIVEAPEVIPAPPVLGGIVMETAPNRDPEKKSAVDFAGEPASFVRRVAAGATDAFIVVAALAGFAGIFHRFNRGLFSIPLLAGAFLAVSGMLWFAYEFLLVVYTGSTPGWRMAGVRLAKFDGSPVCRGLRRWRVLASCLSALSLGLGYFWSILDEDGLCWHDRITHTYLESSLAPTSLAPD
jgi:uncharacterized RDD family membrane protein YckC